jgi:hypothetical protein
VAIEAGLQAKTYGKTPSEIMHADELSRAERFWLNAQVRAATAQFVNEKKEQQRDNATSAGTADPREEQELHDRQDSRADTRESMQQAGMQAPSPDGQKQRLQELQQQEEQAESILSDPSDAEDGGDL